jgi:hypothetical protein
MKSEIRDARAVDQVRESLEKLRQRGFVTVHGLEQDGEGARHLVSGPTGVFYVVATRRRYDDEQLRETRRRAEELGHELDTWVTPVICLAASFRGKPHRREGAWIVPRKQLVDWIAGRRNPVLESEYVAHLADALGAPSSATPASIEGPSESTALLDRALADQVNAVAEGDGARQFGSGQAEPA